MCHQHHELAEGCELVFADLPIGIFVKDSDESLCVLNVQGVLQRLRQHASDERKHFIRLQGATAILVRLVKLLHTLLLP